MMKLLPLLIACLMAGSAVFSEARLPAGVLSALSDEVGWFRVSEASDLTAVLTDKKKHSGMWSVAIKYVVAPDTLHDFAERWEKLEKQASHSAGNLKFSLHKTLNDNYNWLACEEWKSHADWMDHVESRHLKDWHKWLADNKVVYFVKPVRKVTDDFFRAAEEEGGVGRRHKSERVGLAFRFRVQPGKWQDFVEAWRDVGKATSKEDGNSAYTLRKSLLDNTDLYAAGEWESWEDLFDHLESDHFQSLKDFAADNDVFWEVSPVKSHRDTWD